MSLLDRPETLTGPQIRAIREAAGYTQEAMARDLHVTVSSVNRWERGHAVPSRLAVDALLNFCAIKRIPYPMVDPRTY